MSPQVDYIIIAQPTRVQRIWNWIGKRFVNLGVRLLKVGAWCQGIDTGEIKAEVVEDERD
jgi:hypothetical protein